MPIRPWWSGPLLIAAVCAVAAAPAAAAPPAIDLRGDWNGQSNLGAPYVEHFTSVDCATGAISGTGGGGGYTWPISGTLDGSKLTLTDGPYDQLKGYTAHTTGTISAD